MKMNKIHENQNEIKNNESDDNYHDKGDVTLSVAEDYEPSLTQQNGSKKNKNQITKLLSKDYTNEGYSGDQNKNEEYEELDARSYFVNEKIKKRKENFPKSIIEKAEMEKKGIERRLEDSDKALSELIQLGTELVTNVKVANEKREVARRNFEAAKREELLQDLQNESLEAMKKFETITSKWSELDGIKEPMGLYEELQLQKERIADLMKQKDDIIKECQEEIKRADKTYYDDLQRQSSDIYSLVERIDNQIELIKNAYNDHIELLQNTIEIERKNMSEKANTNWNELYNKWLNNEQIKIDNEKLKENLFKNELERIILEYEEIIRSTRIRLEKEAEQLQLELRSTKNHVFLNTEKLDYNYQVLKKRENENYIICNQQKKRLNKLNNTIMELNKKISDTELQTKIEREHLEKEILKLRRNIDDLQMKTDKFVLIDENKYEAVWKIHDQEAKNLIKHILNIDKILYEQQLGLEWIPPKKDLYPSLESKLFNEKNMKHNNSIMPDTIQTFTGSLHEQDYKNGHNKLNGAKLLRKILYKIADHSGFLIEDKLHEILKPYTEKEKTLVKIDEIFTALGITKIEEIELLKEYFIPYSWCPNCSPSEISKKSINEKLEKKLNKDFNIIDDQIRADENVEERIYNDGEEDEDDGNEDDNIQSSGAISLQPKCNEKGANDNFVNDQCPNHNLIIESALVITALRNFMENKSKFESSIERQESLINKKQNNKNFISILSRMSKNDIHDYWSKYEMIFPEEKQKLWKFLEYGLTNYLKILKEREELNSECILLKKQNIELKHLLKKYIPVQMNERNTTPE